jgi:O-antigen ligase
MGVALIAASGACIVTNNFIQNDYVNRIVDGSPQWQLFCATLFGYVSYRIVTAHWVVFRDLFINMWPLMLLLLLCLLSAGWSIFPATTLRRAIALSGFAVCIIWFIAAHKYEDVVRVLAIAVCILVLASLTLLLVAPSYAVQNDDQYTGAWRGTFGHKNTLGKVLVAAILVLWQARWVVSKRVSHFFLCVIIVALLLLAGCESATSVVTLVVCSMLLWSRKAFLRSSADGWAFLLLLTACGGVAALMTVAYGIEWGFAALGRDPSFTGRTSVWNYVALWVHDRPVLGWGYGAFWSNYAGEVDLVQMVLGWMPFHAHNGLLEVALEIGLVGALLVTVMLLHFMINSGWMFSRAWKQIDLLPFIIGVMFLLTNLTDVAIVSTYDFTWTLMVCGYACSVKVHSMNPNLNGMQHV